MVAKRSLSPESKLALVRRARRVSGRLPRVWDRRLRELAKLVVDYRGARTSMLRGPLYSLLGRHSGILQVPFGPGRLLVDTADEEIGRAVFMTGGYERAYMEAAVGFLASSTTTVTAGTTFLDVGANIGTSTVDALLQFRFARAVCFEPDARNLRLLKMNLVLNDLDDRVVVHELALTDRDGEARLERSSWNFGDSRLRPADADDVDGGGDVDQVGCVRLDTLVEKGSLSLEDVGLAWIDVQGHEPRVLAGATTLLGAGIPTVIEYAPASLRASGTLEVLEDLVAQTYTRVVDLRLLAHGAGSSAHVDPRDMASLRARVGSDEHTDLLLVR